MRGAVLFLAGLLTMGYAVAALFFARFWRQQGDRLFAAFALAFALMCVQEAISLAGEASLLAYLVRLLAFVVLLAGIADKNVRGSR